MQPTPDCSYVCMHNDTLECIRMFGKAMVGCFKVHLALCNNERCANSNTCIDLSKGTIVIW